MNFADATVVALGDPTTRAALFDEDALASVVAAGYDAPLLAAQAPYSAVFDELRLGVAAPQVATANGVWNLVGGVDRTEASFTISGVGPGTARIDALWRGSVVARVVHETATITDVVTTWPGLGTIDDDIVADLGALPADPAALEAARRTRLLERLRVSLDQPARLSDVRLTEVLADAGLTSVGELIETARGTIAPAAATLTFSPAPPANPAPLALPITAAVLARDGGFSVAQLLADTRLVVERLAPLSLDRPVEPSLHRRAPIVAIWVVPPETFDDDDWPGATAGMNAAQGRAARRAAAAAWLADAGIGLAVPPP